MGSERKLANTVSGKTARACDNCISKRARWYCAADDAFLCQACDASVHSANPLARRHERVRLKTSSIKITSIEKASTVPSWHHGFTRKARTPRFKKNTKSKSDQKQSRNPLHLVPELCSYETSHEENEEELLYRVPILDPIVGELCTSANSDEAVQETINQSKASLYNCNREMNNFHGSLPSEMGLEEFAADVETLLGKGLEDESFDMEGLGLMDCKEKDYLMELNFNDNSMVTCEDEEINGVKKKRKILLRLDYDRVITAWDEQRSPWSTNNGERPDQLDFDECWPYCMGTWGTVHQFGNVRSMGHTPMVDVDREARVSRYREKRRTRLFSKKIRYEVRKLNAEKRPRMKGRFIKRSNFAGSGFPLINK